MVFINFKFYIACINNYYFNSVWVKVLSIYACSLNNLKIYIKNLILAFIKNKVKTTSIYFYYELSQLLKIIFNVSKVCYKLRYFST
jgi:hypothetical protein